MKDVLLLGEPMGMFMAEEIGNSADVNRFTKGIAGAEVNVGTGLARLEYSVEFVTRIGKDPFGYYIANYLDSEGISLDNIIFDEVFNTGLQVKEKVENGDPAVFYYRKGSAFSHLTISDVKGIDFSNIKLFHVTGIPPALNKNTRDVVFYLLEKAKESNCIITFDPNLRPSLWEDEATMISVLNDIASYADVILPGINEGRILTGTEDADGIAEFYHNIGAKVVIIKDGSNGAYVSEVNKQPIRVEGFKVTKVIDTVGAGDGFAVGIISGYLDGLTMEESAIRANAIGSIQVQYRGDNEGLPTRERLSQYILEKQKTSI